MIIRKLTFMIAAGFAALSFSVKAQVNGVSYQLYFNNETKLYECFLNVDEGQTSLAKHKVQFNAQISLAIPAGSEVAIVENFMPLENNFTGQGGKPQKWMISNRVNNDIKGEDFIGVVPKLSPTGFYNDMKQGDKIKLFSFRVSPQPLCGEGVRLFNNTFDPNSKKMEMNGGDFRNGFTIGDVKQKYKGNLETINTALPQGEINIIGEVYETSNIRLQAGEWTNASKYTWTGPNGFFSTQANPTINKLSAKQSGTYTLTVRSEDGCISTKSVELNVVPMNNYVAVEKTEEDQDIDKTETKTAAALLAGEVQTQVFPNPATNFINVSVNAYKGAEINASIIDIDGKVVIKNIFNQTMEGQTASKTIPLKLTGGVYTVVTSIDGVEHTNKFLYVE